MFEGLLGNLFGEPRKRKWREREVERDRHGRTVSKPAGSKRVRELKQTARYAMEMEDRRGPRLRWGQAGTEGWWYIPKGGAVYWVRRQSQPTTIRNHYYIPSSPWPVVPPRSQWGPYDRYNGIPGKTGMSSVVPDDVWGAAHNAKSLGYDRGQSQRTDAFDRRKLRAGVSTELKRPGLRTTTPTRKARKKKR